MKLEVIEDIGTKKIKPLINTPHPLRPHSFILPPTLT